MVIEANHSQEYLKTSWLDNLKLFFSGSNLKKILGFSFVIILTITTFTSVYITSNLNQKQDIRSKASELQNNLSVTSKLEVTLVDPQSAFYGTFQSHNQKVVTNQYGIFMTHLHSSNYPSYDQNTWYLSRSTDGGATFNKIYESTNGTSAPVIETDASGNIYLAHPDWGIKYSQTYSLFYIFKSANNFTNPQITQISNSAAGKYVMMMDESRSQLYYFSHQGSFSIIDKNGQTKNSYTLTNPGTSAYVMYPYLYLDHNNTLYAAWTTSKDNYPTQNKSVYWDIHVVLFKDGANTWQKLDGTKLTLPLVSDETGPTDRITLDDEFGVSTWLSNFFVKAGKIFFMYYTWFNQPPAGQWATNTSFDGKSPDRQHFVRYDLKTGKKDFDIYPRWKGETLSITSLDGFCATRDIPLDPNLYCVGKTPDNKIAVLRSDDFGHTWHDFASIQIDPGHRIYAIGGARKISSEGHLTGSFTEFLNNDFTPPSMVKFFKVKVLDPPLSAVQISVNVLDNKLIVNYNNNLVVTSDWIGLYNFGANDKSYLDWKWLNNTQNQPGNVNNSGQVTFDNLPSGNYEVRYFTRDYSLNYPWKSLTSSKVELKTNTGENCSNLPKALSSSLPLKIYQDNNIFLDWGGLQDKWFIDKNNTWYYIYKDQNGVYIVNRWDQNKGLKLKGKNPEGDVKVTTETSSCYDRIKPGYVFPQATRCFCPDNSLCPRGDIGLCPESIPVSKNPNQNILGKSCQNDNDCGFGYICSSGGTYSAVPTQNTKSCYPKNGLPQ